MELIHEVVDAKPLDPEMRVHFNSEIVFQKAVPFNPVLEGKKLVYAARNLRIVPAKEIWPNIEDADDVTVLVGEHYVHDEWFPLRSSMVINVTGKDHETRNSIYRAID